MKIVPLRKLVAEHSIGFVKVGEDPMFDTGSDKYDSMKNWFVKGEFQIEIDYSLNSKVLRCLRLEKDIQITLNRPILGADTVKSTDPAPTPEHEKELNAEADKIFHVRLFHSPTGRLTNTLALKRSEIPKFIDQSMSKFEVGSGQVSMKKDFFVVRVNFEDKTIDCDRV